MKSTKLFLRAALLGIGLCAPASALGQNAQSETFFAEGRKLRLAGDCAGAIVAFRRSFELAPERIGSLRNIAECERELRRYASSRRSYWDLRRAAMKSNDPSYQGWDKDAETAYDAMTATVPRLTIQLDGDRDGVTVTVDGLVLDPRMLGVELEEDQGAHSIEASFGGVVPLTEKVTLAEGERRTLTLHTPARKKGSIDGRGAMWITGGVAASLGGASLIGAGVAAAIRADALDTISKQCPGLSGCSSSLSDTLDKGRTATAAVNVLLGVGAGAVAIGGGLLIASRYLGAPSREPTPLVSMRVSATAAPGAGFLRIEGSF